MKKIIEYIKFVMSEYQEEEAKEEFLEWSFYLLDNFAKSKGFTDIFHLTANEVTFEDKTEEIDNTIDFIKKYEKNVDGILEELFEIILNGMEKEKEKYPYQLLEEFFIKHKYDNIICYENWRKNEE